ncbi:MAG TPA: WYL domain-containing protein, partial [Anaerolineales bacterium]|nr:WYL domain-containing protein [Anaerolineales bacterium]
EEFWQSWCAEEAQNTSNYAVTVRVTKRALPSVTHRFGAMVRDQLADDVPEGNDDSRILILYFRWIDEARERLLPFGSGVEVLEPYALRASMADIAEHIARLYKK